MAIGLGGRQARLVWQAGPGRQALLGRQAGLGWTGQNGYSPGKEGWHAVGRDRFEHTWRTGRNGYSSGKEGRQAGPCWVN